MFFRAHDIDVHLEGTPKLTEAVADVLRYKGFEAISGSDGYAHITLRFFPGHAPPERIIGETLAQLPVGVWIGRSSEGHFVTDGHSAVFLDFEKRLVDAVIASNEDHDSASPANVFYFVTVSLILMLRHLGYYAVHAACVERDGQGVLLVGRSDTGKSTTTINLVRHGWNYASDDSVVLFSGDDAVGALSMRRDFCIDVSALESYPEMTGRPWPPAPNDADKLRIDLQQVFSGRFVQRVTPTLLVFPFFNRATRNEAASARCAEGSDPRRTA
jgi:hypothetical protein